MPHGTSTLVAAPVLPTFTVCLPQDTTMGVAPLPFSFPSTKTRCPAADAGGTRVPVEAPATGGKLPMWGRGGAPEATGLADVALAVALGVAVPVALAVALGVAVALAVAVALTVGLAETFALRPKTQ